MTRTPSSKNGLRWGLGPSEIFSNKITLYKMAHEYGPGPAKNVSPMKILKFLSANFSKSVFKSL